MGIFDFAFKKIILSTFQNDLDKFRTTSLRVQIEAGEKVDFGKGITGGDIYWHDIRLIHSGFYALYSLFANVPNSYLILGADLLYSMAANIKYR